MTDLKQYGFNNCFSADAALYPDLQAGRVVSQHHDLYKLVTEAGEQMASVSGKFRYNAKQPSDYPAVGDFVMASIAANTGDNAIIQQLLPRKSALTRKNGAERKAQSALYDTQVLAANMDTVFICMSLNNDYNLRRLERYLAIVWDSRAIPVLILTKADLSDDLEEKLKELSSVAIGINSIVTSCYDPFSYEKVRAYLGEGKTACFIGSSGVGKSTLINCLAGSQVFATSEIRSDDRGRHTTTSRELFLLPGGGVVIDTPGLRELGSETADLSKSFTDIKELATRCRFKDCSHNSEPGCAVKAAIEKGQLDSQRLESYLKLKKEMKYDGLNSRQIETEKINAMFAEFGGVKNAMRFAKEKNKQKS